MRPDDGGAAQTKGCTEIKLFGQTIGVSSEDGKGCCCGGDGCSATIRKSKSMGNIDKLICKNIAAAAAYKSGYLSDGNIHGSKKRGNPWTEEEHLSFLDGLHHLGKGNWKGISRKFVPSRKSSQVASHAQKYFNRLNTVSTGAHKKRRRASVFDIASTHDTNQSSQAAQPNNAEIASSSSADTNVNASEPSIPANVVPNSKKPPLSPMTRSIQDIRDVIYKPRVSSHQTQAVMPSIYWVPVVNFPNKNTVFVPKNIDGGFKPHQPRRQGWIRAPPTTSTTNNDGLNHQIMNLTL